ncbi:hypothetical protein L7J86_00045 [endosymbiont of Metamasius hemipterus]|uniref:Penicillin-binding protein transpeptidase domain-containing protein n=1 Tax=endosymbiont of Metamasius hemipterus TaxID=204627 RepID=A0ABT0TXD7_9GAMM|nr:hypothetical protein [endosymbiont of Metamasius hemipterus]
MPYIRIGIELGFNNIKNFLYKLGANINNNINSFPSISIGSIYLTPIEIAQIYQTLLNNGNRINIYLIKNINNNYNLSIYENKNRKIFNIINKEPFYLTLYSMQKVSEYGTAKILNNEFKNLNIASKTGTTKNLKNS